MLNLVRLRGQAHYPDGRQRWEGRRLGARRNHAS
jgi:hypothetical protein